MDWDVRRNPALLKLDLYCRGMRVDDSCLVEEDGGRKILRTRAGLGSGLELLLPGGLWTNVPVTESFARRSPYVLHRDGGRYWVRRDGEAEAVARVELSPRPSWYDAKTSSGKSMTRVGTLQGTYLGVYPAKVCEYWTEKPQRSNCKFCSVGLNLGVDDADEKSVAEVMEVVEAARAESGITYVDFNTGHYAGDTYLDILGPYIRRIKERAGLLVGVQTPPHHDLSRYDALREMGVNRVSFCFEIFDPCLFKEVCPGKDREYGLERYLEAVRYCASLGRKGPRHEPWVANGEIIAGLEPPASSIRAIDWITSVGAIPTVCVFRPLAGTDYADVPPPETEALVPVFRRLYEACMERGLPIGCAPNIHVSLVLLPDEARWLSDRRFPLQSLKLRLIARAAAWQLERNMQRAARATGPRSALAEPGGFDPPR
ncbi:MAG TPA: radical SAM protein [Vicinamibacteria bacterium]|nr:radical SAM protein [Vicinamibacteria bacterium]